MLRMRGLWTDERPFKGRFFRGVLGSDEGTLAPALEDQLLSNVDAGTVTYRAVNGQTRAVVTAPITGPNGRSAAVTSVWQLIGDDTYVFITAYPG